MDIIIIVHGLKIMLGIDLHFAVYRLVISQP